MNMPMIRATSSAGRALALGAVLFVAAVPAADALVLDLASIPGGTIDFSGGSFSFNPAPSFSIIGTSGTGAGPLGSLGLEGAIGGSFAIGNVTTSGPLQSAPVVSTGGSLTIDDGYGNFLTADLSFNEIYTIGSGGIIDTDGGTTANLSNIQYTGPVLDLIQLFQEQPGTQTVTFTFNNPTRTVTDLKNAGTPGNPALTTGYSSQITTVPLPAAAWLFGSALAGLTAVARRRRAS